MKISKFKKLNLIKRYIKDVSNLSLYLQKKYCDKKLIVYGVGGHTKDLLEIYPKSNIVAAVKQSNIDSGYVEHNIDVKTIDEESVKKFDFDYLILLGWWSDENIVKLGEKLQIAPSKLVAPYKDNKLFLKSKAHFSQNNALKLSNEKPNLVLILTVDIKDMATMAAKELSSYFNLIKIYTQNNHLYLSKENSYFSQIIHLENSYILIEKLLKNSVPEIVFYWLNSQLDTWVGSYIQSILDKKTKFILGTTDFFYTKVFNTPDKTLMDTFGFNKELYVLNKKCELELIKKSDGIVTNFGGAYSKNILAKYAKKTCFAYGFIRPEDIVFREKELDLNSVEVCYAGGISGSHEYSCHSVTTFDKVFEEIAKQGIGISIYSYLKLSNSLMYSMLTKSYPNIVFKDFVASSLLPLEMSKYDFGILFYNLTKDVQKVYKSHMSSVFQAKLIAYLCAGIPVIVNKEWTIIADFVEKNSIGIAIAFDELYTIKQRITDVDYKKMKENVRNFQIEYTKNSEQQKLADFCSDILN